MTTARLALAGLFILAALSDASAATKKSRPASGGFDGLWSVLIITEKGGCDRGYRYAVRIRGSRVGHADPANSSFRIAGNISGGGAIRVSVARGNQSANGSGRMSRNAG